MGFLQKLADPLNLAGKLGDSLGTTAGNVLKLALQGPVGNAGALKQVAGSALGSVLTGRALVQGKIQAQDMESARTLDVLGSPATAGTKLQDAARAGAVAFGAYQALPYLLTGSGAGSAATAAPTAAGMGSGTAAAGGGFLSSLGKWFAGSAATQLVNYQLQRRAMTKAQAEADQLLAQFNQANVPPGGNMFEGFDIGGLLGSSMDALLKYQLQRKLATSAPVPMMQTAQPMATPVAFPSLPSLPAIGGAIGGMLGLGAGTAMRAAAGLVRSAAGKIRGVMLSSGRFISSKKGAALAKRVGIDAAAAALGVSAVEMAQMVLDSSASGRGRGRGITAASMRTTRRTIRQVSSLSRQIAQACSSSSFTRRSSARRPFPVARASARCK